MTKPVMTFREANKLFSVVDWWFYGLSEKDRLRIERERGIAWEDLSEVGKKMIYQEENKNVSGSGEKG